MNDIQTLAELVSTLEIGGSATAGNLALIPLLVKDPARPPNPPRYLLYQQALDMALISIEEVSEAGAVGTLRVVNRGGEPVLLVEGEVLLGMKQTRVLNLTILVPATAVLEVPVSCVEAGRWHAVSEESTGKSAVNLAPSVRAAKTVTVARSMRSTRTFASDQGAVWAGVNRMLDRYGAHAPSRSYGDLAGTNAVHLTAIASSVEPAPGQVGVIACVGGRVACVDIFETPEVLASLWSGLVASYQAEALIADNVGSKRLGARADAAARRWFRSIPAGSTSVGPDIGLGSHISVVAPDLEAAALVHAGQVLHLSAFPAHQAANPTRFIPPARRRN
ncbi:MAG: hypothetical protein E6J20_13315 [Chloroflexi bacterium]|nr:MAG: hypothetical protein E6J20_13315 [Chloroflexota bacterium]